MSEPKSEHKTKTAHKAAERTYINDAATHESGDFGVCNNKLLETKDPNTNAANQYTEPCDNKLSQPRNEHANAAVTKTAELFNTNRTYINDAAKLKTERPDAFDNLLSEPKKEDTTARAAHKAPEPITQLIVEQPREKREAVEQERRSKIAESRQSETSQLIAQSKNHNDSKVG